MRDPFSWSIPFARIAGITVRIHLLFPVVAAALILRVAFHKTDAAPPPGTVWDATILMAILFLSVLLHEFGHCAAARWVNGSAYEILIWPLGGLAAVNVPSRPRAHFLVAAAGPLTNLCLCLIAWGLILILASSSGLEPPWSPYWYPYRLGEDQHGVVLARLFSWDGHSYAVHGWPLALAARAFWTNWVLFLFNIVLVGFPMDSGRMLQSALWPWYGYRQATLVAVTAGFITMVILGIVALAQDEILTLCLALFIYATCRQQLILLETGADEAAFGYDFSQGYTSLGDPAPPQRRRRAGPVQRWLQRRAAQRLQREEKQRRAEEHRMDELLEKVQRLGMAGLTEEEQKFLKRVSDRYRNRH